jgi:hypothetical protein
MVFTEVLTYVWNLFSLWAQTLFILPFKNPDMLWILVPLWLSWFFGEFFQEKLGTSFGNAISNAVIVLWAGVDCIRQTIYLMNGGEIQETLWIRFMLCGLLILYGIIIIIYGTKTKDKVKRFGRIRDVTYAFAILVPVLYNAAPLIWQHFLAAIIFFPIFHYTIQLIDLKTPTPKALQKDINTAGQSKPNIKKDQQSQQIAMPQTAQSTKQTTQQNNDYKKPPEMSYWNQ